MERKEIEKILEKVHHEIYGNSYALVEGAEAIETIEGEIPAEYESDSIRRGLPVVVISLDRPFDDEEDVSDVLSYCGCYAGQ